VHSKLTARSFGLREAPLARPFFRLIFYVCLVELLPALSYGQFSGNIQGIVSDNSGAVVGDASVRLRNADTGVETQAKTSASGNYRFSSLEPGHYLVITNAPGFREAQVDVRLGTSETQGINVTLQLASSTQAINVVEQSPTLDTDDSRLQATLSAASVRDLPEINRNIFDVLAVAPGVVGTGTRGAGESPGGGNDNFGTQTPSISANGRSYTATELWSTAWTQPASSRMATLSIVRIPTQSRKCRYKQIPGMRRTTWAAPC
jgi:Carboxypeptidase regulatory-like domain